MTNKSVMYMGKTFNSLDELAQKLDIPVRNFYSPHNKHKTLEQIVLQYRNGASKGVEYKGTQYPKVTTMCEALGLDYNLLMTQRSRGKTLEEAIQTQLESKPIYFEGHQYDSLQQLCNAYHVESYVIKRRLDTGKTLYEAIYAPKREYDFHRYQYKNEKYSTKSEMALSQGYSYALIKMLRIRYHFEDDIQVLDFLNYYLSHFKGNRPSVLSCLPVIIYRDEWYFKMKDFYQAVNVKPNTMAHFSSTNKNLTLFEQLKILSTKTEVRWVDKATNQVTNQLELTKKYGCSRLNLVKKGYAFTINRPVHPDIIFQPQGYNATPFEMFDRALNYFFDNYSNPHANLNNHPDFIEEYETEPQYV